MCQSSLYVHIIVGSKMYANTSVCVCACVCVCVCVLQYYEYIMSTSWWNVRLPRLKPYVAVGAISPDNDALFNLTRRLTD